MKENYSVRYMGISLTVCMLLSVGCNKSGDGRISPQIKPAVPLNSVAEVLSSVPFGMEQMNEVLDAVSASSDNGYDEEYMLRDLFVSPGEGVGDDKLRKAGLRSSSDEKHYDRPFRDLISNYIMSRPASKAGDMTPQEYLEALRDSDIQIYWPNFDKWDGGTTPVITFDPEDGSDVNIGYSLIEDETGMRRVETVMVDEKMSEERPVWVINRNDDSIYDSFEILKHSAETGSGGEITVRPNTISQSTSETIKTLVLKEFTMLRHYDCWFAGASEFFIKCGAVEDFYASTEAELKTYSPLITDFMLVVKRNQLGKSIPLNVILVSKWTKDLEDCAFMVVEDDGGTQSSWKCSATVKYKSKSYGFDMSIPLNSRDDIVWRGQISKDYFVKYDGQNSHFGGVDVVFTFL